MNGLTDAVVTWPVPSGGYAARFAAEARGPTEAAARDALLRYVFDAVAAVPVPAGPTFAEAIAAAWDLVPRDSRGPSGPEGSVT